MKSIFLKGILLSCILLLFFEVKTQDISMLEKELSVAKGDEKIQILNDLTWEYSFGNQTKAIAYGEEAVKLSKTAKNNSLLSDAYNSLGNAYFYMSNYEKSIEYNLAALQLRTQLNDSIGMASSYMKLGLGYFETNQLQKALESHLSALGIYESKNHSVGMSFSLNNIGAVYKALRQYDKALECHRKSESISRQMGDEYNVAKALGNVAVIFQNINQYDSAIYVNLEVEEIFENAGAKLELSTIYNNLGVLYRLVGNSKKGLEYYEKALALSYEINDKRGVANAHNNIGNVNTDLQKFEDAEINYNKGLEVAKEIGAKSVELKSYLGLSEMYERLSNNKLSLQFYKKYSALKDSIFDEESAKSIVEMQTKYDTEKKERELELQSLKIEKQNAELSKRSIMLFSSIALIFVLLTIAYLFINRQKLKQKNLLIEMALKEEIAKKELHQKIGEERNRISRDLHDSLGAELTLISSSADTMAYTLKNEETKSAFNEIANISRNSVNILRDTIWAIKKDSLDIDELQLKLKQFAQQRKSQINVEIENNITQQVFLTPGQSLHLFRVCQEAINNAMKHADCEVLGVHFHLENNHIKVVINDNGKGFDENIKLGYGLSNMKERIEEINGTFNIKSSQNKGTEIEILIPLNV